ncbi:hypothetical protein OSTOST_22593, partial [Ostertagia ostertagi]
HFQVIRKFLPIFFLTIYFLPILTTWFLYPATTYLRIGPQIPAFGYGAGFDYKKVYPNVCVSLLLIFCPYSVLVYQYFLDMICNRSIAVEEQPVHCACHLHLLNRLSGVLCSNNGSTAVVKAERSLSFLTFTTCICMLTLAFTNLCFLLYYDILLEYMLRPFQVDLLLFLPIWVLYFTHPAFKRSSTTSASVNVVVSTFHSPKQKVSLKWASTATL